MGISTAAIADRIDAGESVSALAEDYDLSPEEIEQAVLYSRAASAGSTSPIAISRSSFRDSWLKPLDFSRATRRHLSTRRQR